jgi:hypothetical protein
MRSSEEQWRDVRDIIEAMNQAKEFQWWRHFKDDSHSGRPGAAITDMNADKVEQLLKKGMLCSLNVPLKRVVHIVTMELTGPSPEAN